METYLRPKIQPVFNSIAKLCIHHGFTPNAITYCSFVSGMASALLIAFNLFIPALIFLLLSGTADIMDGTIARLSNSSTKAGAFIDLISDRLVEGMIIIGFSIAYPQHNFVYILFLVAVLFHFATFAIAGSLFKNTGEKSMFYIPSIVSRAEAFVTFSGIILFPSYLALQLSVFTFLVFFAAINQFLQVFNYAILNDH